MFRRRVSKMETHYKSVTCENLQFFSSVLWLTQQICDVYLKDFVQFAIAAFPINNRWTAAASTKICIVIIRTNKSILVNSNNENKEKCNYQSIVYLISIWIAGILLYKLENVIFSWWCPKVWWWFDWRFN